MIAVKFFNKCRVFGVITEHCFLSLSIVLIGNISPCARHISETFGKTFGEYTFKLFFEHILSADKYRVQYTGFFQRIKQNRKKLTRHFTTHQAVNKSNKGIPFCADVIFLFIKRA